MYTTPAAHLKVQTHATMPEETRQSASQKNDSNTVRIAKILSGFDAFNTPRRVADVLQEANINRATGMGLIRSLVKFDLLVRVDHGWLQLGPKAEELAFHPVEANFSELVGGRSTAMQVPARPEVSGVRAHEGVGPAWDERLVKFSDCTAYRRTGPVRLAVLNATSLNPWRTAFLQSMSYAAKLNTQTIAALDVFHAQDDPDLQIAQARQAIAAGYDALILSVAPGADVEMQAICEQALAEGVAVICVDRRPRAQSSYLSFVTASNMAIGQISARWLAEHLQGQGRIWMLSGVQGASPAIRRQVAALEEFSHHPQLKIEAVTYTNWTEEGGRRAVEELLETFGTTPDGIWCDSGLQGVGSLEVFRQRGLSAPPHTGGDLNRMYKMCIQHKVPLAAVDYPAAMGAVALETTLQALSGGSVQHRVEVPLKVILSRGFETQSVKADEWVERHVQWNMVDDFILSQGPSSPFGKHEREGDYV